MNKKTISGILLLIFVIIIAYFLSGPYKKDTVKVVEGVCTMDALVCPDGTAVGRSGPMCEFDPCSASGFYSGLLVQQGGQFFLSIPSAPDSDPEQVIAYFLPLQFSRVSNALADFVNNKVKVSGFFERGNLFQVEAIELE